MSINWTFSVERLSTCRLLLIISDSSMLVVSLLSLFSARISNERKKFLSSLVFVGSSRSHFSPHINRRLGCRNSAMLRVHVWAVCCPQSQTANRRYRDIMSLRVHTLTHGAILPNETIRKRSHIQMGTGVLYYSRSCLYTVGVYTLLFQTVIFTLRVDEYNTRKSFAVEADSQSSKKINGMHFSASWNTL